MITNRMRRILEQDLNYLPEEIDKMDPQIAPMVIERKLSRPSTGMPKKWIKYHKSEASMSKYAAGLKNSFERFTNFAVNQVLPVALPIIFFIYGLPMIVQSLANDPPEQISLEKKSTSFPWQKKEVSVPPDSSRNYRSQRTVLPDGRGGKKGKKIDMKSLNNIVQKPNFFTKLIGR